MIKGIQTVFEQAGKYGCYFFSIIELAEKETKKSFNVLQVMDKAIRDGWLSFDWNALDDSFTVLQPALLFGLLTGKRWTIRHDSADYKPKENERVVYLWKNDRTGHKHFRLKDWDSLKNSVTVKEGEIVATRVFKEKQ